MFHGIDMRGIAIQALADHPAYLAMAFYPAAQELARVYRIKSPFIFFQTNWNSS